MNAVLGITKIIVLTNAKSASSRVIVSASHAWHRSCVQPVSARGGPHPPSRRPSARWLDQTLHLLTLSSSSIPKSSQRDIPSSKNKTVKSELFWRLLCWITFRKQFYAMKSDGPSVRRIRFWSCAALFCSGSWRLTSGSAQNRSVCLSPLLSRSTVFSSRGQCWHLQS